MADPRDVIVKPIVSEKSYALSEKGVYIFIVRLGQQGRDPPFRREGFQRQGDQGKYLEPARQAQAQPQAKDFW